MRLLFLCFAVLMPLSLTGLFAGSILEGYSVVQGKNYAFDIKAPRSWVLDNEAGKSQGINLVLYPTGTNWQESKAVIYVRVRTLTPAIQNVTDQVNATIRNLKEAGSPNAKAKYVRTLTTQDASKAQVYYYTGDQYGNLEAAAYILSKGSIHFITLSARDQETFNRAISAFDSVVTSYEDLVKKQAEGSQTGD